MLMIEGLPGHAAPSALVDLVWDRTGGVPMFVEEVLFALRHVGTLVVTEGDRWSLAPDADLTQVPASVEGPIMAQLDAMPSGLREVLRWASVLGGVFWDGWIEDVGLDDVQRRLAELTSREVIVAQDESELRGCREYVFRSSMVQDIAYQTLPRRERVQMHSLAADWFERRGGAPALLAYHLARAERPAEAAVHFLAAGDIARASYANDEAVEAYSAALSHGSASAQVGGAEDRRAFEATSVAALFGREEVLARLGRWEDALADLDEIERRAQSIEDETIPIRVAIRRAEILGPRDRQKASKQLDVVLMESQRIGSSSLECRGLLEKATAAASTGHLADAVVLASRAVTRARKSHTASLVRAALLTHGEIATLAGNHYAALVSLEEALDIATRSQQREQIAEVLVTLGFVRAELGSLDGAIADLGRARDICTETGNQRLMVASTAELGWTLWRRSSRIEARDLVEESVESARQLAIIESQLGGVLYLALMDLGRGELDEALGRALRVGRRASRRKLEQKALHAAMVAASALYVAGRAEDASRKALRAVGIFKALGGTRQFEVELHLVAAACLRATSHAGEAEKMERMALASIERRSGAIGDHGVRTALRAVIGAGMPPFVRQAFEAALARGERTSWP